MDISVFDFKDYKRYLRELLAKVPAWKHGGRLKYADAAECRPGYVTQVLNRDADFSMEQGERIARFIGLSADETRFFLHLISYARAGTPTLREFLKLELEAMQIKRVDMRDVAKPSEMLSETEQAIYYSSWHYAVVHILCTIPELASRERMAAHLGVSAERIGDILGFLQAAGLVHRAKSQLVVTSKRVFVGKESAFNYRHHANFRQLVMTKLETLRRDDFHYSGVHSLSNADKIKVIELIRSLITASREVIRASPEEVLVGFNIDFFRI